MPLKGMHVLVIDDDEDSREIARRMLTAVGARVDLARSAHEGLDRLAKHCPDLLLVDIMMPGMDGLAFARAVRRMPDCRHVRMVALTALRFVDSYLATWSAGFDGHVEKPLTFENLEALAERHVGPTGGTAPSRPRRRGPRRDS